MQKLYNKATVFLIIIMHVCDICVTGERVSCLRCHHVGGSSPPAAAAVRPLSSLIRSAASQSGPGQGRSHSHQRPAVPLGPHEAPQDRLPPPL